MQIYLQKPVGVKSMYSRGMIDLCMELHIAPNLLFNKMGELANLDTPRIEHLWETYGNNPRKLARAATLWREMRGFNNADAFYQGVETSESFEKDFKPVAEGLALTPVMLILILDLYFRLTPITMVKDTPEVQELARLIKRPLPEAQGRARCTSDRTVQAGVAPLRQCRYGGTGVVCQSVERIF